MPYETHGGRTREIAEVKCARLVAHYHPAVTWNITVHLATPAKCQSAMKHGHRPVIVVLFCKVPGGLVARVREGKLASRQEPLVDGLLKKPLAVVPLPDGAKAFRRRLGLQPRRLQPSKAGVPKRRH